MYWAVVFSFFSWPHFGIFVFGEKKNKQQQQTKPTSVVLLQNIRSLLQILELDLLNAMVMKQS